MYRQGGEGIGEDGSVSRTAAERIAGSLAQDARLDNKQGAVNPAPRL